MSTQKVEAKDKPFHVIHSNGDIIAGFDDQRSAIDDCAARNARAVGLDVRPDCSYSWQAKKPTTQHTG